MDLKFPVTVVVNEALRVRGWVEHHIPLGTRTAACNRTKQTGGSLQAGFFLSFLPLINLEIIITWLPWISGAQGPYVFCFAKSFILKHTSWFKMPVEAYVSNRKEKQKIGSRMLCLHWFLRTNARNSSHGFFLYYRGYCMYVCTVCMA